MKFEIKVRAGDAWTLYNILPVNKLLTCSLPVNKDGLADAIFTSAIDTEELKKVICRMENGPAMMESLKINYD